MKAFFLMLVLLSESSFARIYMQRGYLKKSGKYILSHLKTTPDKSVFNNLKPRLRKIK